MKFATALFVFALASCGPHDEPAAAAIPPAADPIYGYEVVATYPHATDAFTEGLFYQDGFLYESTGLNGKSSIRKVDLQSGRVLQQRDISNAYFGEGIIAWGDRLMELTWRSQKGFIYDFHTFEPEGEWSYPGEGWSLTRNDQFIIMSDGTPDIRFLNPETLKEDHRISVTYQGKGVRNLNELEWINGEIWANVWQTDVIARIDPQTGHVVGRIDLSGLLTPEERAGPDVDVLNGIAWDRVNNRIFVTGKNWPKLFEIRLVPR